MNRFGTCAAAIGGMLVVTSAASATVVNGYDWDYVYTGDQLPTSTDSKWSVNGGSGSLAQHNQPGTITLTSPVGDYIYLENLGEWAPSTTATAYAEFKVKVDSFNAGEDSGTSLNVFTSGGGGVQVLLRADGIHLLDNNGDPGTLAYGVDTTAYHVYRIAASSVTDTYSIDVDGTTVLTNKPLHTGLAFDILRIGDPGSNLGGVATYEYVAFNNDSAPVAVPEPAGLAILAAGAVLLRRRRGVA